MLAGMPAPTVAVRLYRPVALALGARGIEPDALFAEFGMTSPSKCGWNERVPIPQIAGIWDRLIAATGDPCFPLHAAEHVDLTTCDVITYLEANANTLREALAKKLEYLPLITDAIAWTLEVSGERALLTLHEQPPGPAPAAVSEYLLASRHLFLRQMGPPDWHVSAVSFQHAAPSDTGEHVRIFGLKPHFGRAQNEIEFPAGLLDAPMRQRDAALSELLARYAQHSLSMVPRAQTVADRVRDALRSGFDPGIDTSSRKLNLSKRSLQRLLKREGTSYAEISAQVRRALAERLLVRGELATSEVAYALGFRDVPAFHKAFLRWTGTTPGEFRARNLGAFLEPRFGRLGEMTPTTHGTSSSARSEDR